MGRARQLPDISVLRRLRRERHTLQQIADDYGVTESAVFKALDRVGDIDRLPTYRDILPWKIAPEHKKTAIMDHFRTLATERAGRTASVPRKAYMLDWLQGLKEADVVVSYHPDAPPNAASPRSGGFYYVPRDERDTWIIRVPEELSDRHEIGQHSNDPKVISAG